MPWTRPFENADEATSGSESITHAVRAAACSLRARAGASTSLQGALRTAAAACATRRHELQHQQLARPLLAATQCLARYAGAGARTSPNVQRRQTGGSDGSVNAVAGTRLMRRGRAAGRVHARARARGENIASTHATCRMQRAAAPPRRSLETHAQRELHLLSEWYCCTVRRRTERVSP